MALLPYMIPTSYRNHVKARAWREFRDDPVMTAHLEHNAEFSAAFKGDNIELSEWIDGLDADKLALLSDREKASIQDAMAVRPRIPHANEKETELFDTVRRTMRMAVVTGNLREVKVANSAYLERAQANRRAFVAHMKKMDDALSGGPDAAVEWLGGLSGFTRQDMSWDHKKIKDKLAAKIEKIEKNGGPTSNAGAAALSAFQTTINVVGEEMRIHAVDRHDRIGSSVENYRKIKMGM